MRLGGRFLKTYSCVDEWLENVIARHYNCVAFPHMEVKTESDLDYYKKVTKENDIVTAEVHAWSNMLCPDEKIRDESVRLCIERLRIAEEVGAKCCVNVGGSRGIDRSAPHKDNFLPESFDQLVETVQYIIDTVKPQNTKFSIEPMNWEIPDSTDEYVRLAKGIDRQAFGAHLDIVNMITSPKKHFNNSEMISEFFEKLGDKIVCIHLKDQILSDQLTVHLDETVPGRGNVDFSNLIKNASALDIDMPMVIERMHSDEEYEEAYKYIVDLIYSLGLEDRFVKPKF